MIIEHQFDPLGKFKKFTKAELSNMLGTIPGWASNPDYFNLSLKEALDKQYCCGMYENESAKIEKDGSYNFPGNQKLPPILMLKRGTETLYQYQYGLVAIVQENGDSFATRMD